MGICPTVSAWTEIGGVELMRVKRERKTMGICPTVRRVDRNRRGRTDACEEREKDDGHMPYC